MRTWLCCLCAAFLSACESPSSAPAGKVGSGSPGAAWETVYKVLQHPRCMNCHPVGDAPLVGDASQPHPQNVQRGALGVGLFAIRCNTCHQPQNTDGPHLPPGAPRWQLPTKGMPLVFEGKSPKDLAQQLRDPKRNGGKGSLEFAVKDPGRPAKAARRSRSRTRSSCALSRPGSTAAARLRGSSAAHFAE